MPDQIKAGLENWRTTSLGTGLSLAYYGQNVGFQFPSNQGEWINFGIALLIQILAMFAKDAAVGSRP